MILRFPIFCLALALYPATSAAAQTLTLPIGTPLPVRIEDHLPMRVGQPVRAQLMYPVYADNTLVLPAKTVVNGTVVELRSDHSRRVRAAFGGDLTPFRKPVVRFNSFVLADG